MAASERIPHTESRHAFGAGRFGTDAAVAAAVLTQMPPWRPQAHRFPGATSMACHQLREDECGPLSGLRNVMHIKHRSSACMALPRPIHDIHKLHALTLAAQNCGHSPYGSLHPSLPALITTRYPESLMPSLVATLAAARRSLPRIVACRSSACATRENISKFSLLALDGQMFAAVWPPPPVSPLGALSGHLGSWESPQHALVRWG